MSRTRAIPVPWARSAPVPWYRCASARRETEPRRHADELGDRRRLHLLHDVRAMGFDRSLRRRQIESDLLVQHAGDDAGHHFALARGETLVPLAQRRRIVPLLARDAV